MNLVFAGSNQAVSVNALHAFSRGAPDTHPLTVMAPSGVINLFNVFRAGRDPLTIDYFGGQGAFRESAELTLVVQALRLGGLDNAIDYVPYVNSGHQRYIDSMVKGRYVMMGESIWLSDVKDRGDELYVTQPLVRPGEFYVGLYTHPENKKALKVKTIEQVRQLSIVTNPNWQSDVDVINAIGFDKVYYAEAYTSMLRMVKRQRADVVLSAFSSHENFEHGWDGGVLIPIPGIKVMFPGSRHWIVSKAHQDGEMVYQALEKGIEALREQGKIRKAYMESGFFNQNSANWTPLEYHLATKASAP